MQKTYEFTKKSRSWFHADSHFGRERVRLCVSATRRYFELNGKDKFAITVSTVKPSDENYYPLRLDGRIFVFSDTEYDESPWIHDMDAELKAFGKKKLYIWAHV